MVDDLHEDLTPDERELVLDRLRGLTRSGTTIVVGSLDPALAPLADVVLALDGDGRPWATDGLRATAATRPAAAAPPTSLPPPPPTSRRRLMRSFSIASGELKRLVSARPFRVAAGVICLVPLLYGVLYLWAFWDPYQRLDKLPVAVVNVDRPVVAGGQSLHVGADLVRQLKASKSFDWRLVSAEQARAGLRAGRYYMALTIPADFSKRLGSADGASPSAATLTVQDQEAHNLLATQIGSRVFLEIRASLSAATSQRYLSHIFVGLHTVKSGLTKGGTGAAA